MCWQQSSSCSPGSHCLSSWQAHIAGSCSMCCSLGPPGLFLQSCYPAGQSPACTNACSSDHRTAPSSPPQSPHSSRISSHPLCFCSHLDLPPPLCSQPPSSAHMSTVGNYSATPFLSVFKIADNSSFLPHPWTQIILQHPFVTDSTSFPDFPHRKNKSWLQAAAMKNLPGCIQRKEKEQLSEEKKKKRWCMIACIIQVGIFLWANNYCDQGRFCTRLTGTLSIKNECQHKVWNTQRFNMILFLLSSIYSYK